MGKKNKAPKTIEATAPSLIKLVDHLSIATVCLAAWLPFLSFTMIGIWITVEPVVAGWFMLATVAACMLLLRQIAGSGISIPDNLYPLAGFVLWAGISSFMQHNTTIGLIGAPETGEGMASFCAIFTTAWLIRDLWRVEKYRKYIITSYIASAAIMAACEIGGIKIVTYPDYLAFIAIAVAAAATLWPNGNVMLHVAQFFLWVMLASNNMAGAIIAGGTVGIWLLQAKTNSKLPQFYIAAAAITAPVAIAIMLILLNGSSLAPSNSGSLGARVIVSGIAEDVLKTSPLSETISGHGWGSTSDMVAERAMINHRIKIFLGRDYAPEWVGVNGDMFHSHNEFLESLLATGIIGAALLILWFWRMASSSNGWLSPAWVGLAALSGLWFWLPHVLPSIALLTGITNGRKNAPKIIGILAAIACTVTMLTATAIHSRDMMKGMQANFMVAQSSPPENFSLFDWMNGSYKRFFMTCQGMISDLANENYMLENGVNARVPTNYHTDWLLLALHDIDRLDAQNLMTPRLRVLEANIINLPASLKQKSAERLLQQLIPQWQNRIEKIFFALPHRNDLLLAFYTSAEAHPEWNLNSHDLAEHILSKYPEEPVSLWFEGLWLYKNGNKNNAMINMKRALALGVDRFVPVTDDMKSLIGGAGFDGK